MSRIWSREEMDGATRLESWSAMCAAPPQTFRARYGEERQGRAWNITHPGRATHAADAPPVNDDPVEIAAQAAFVQGFQEGERVAREAAAVDNGARLTLAEALQGVVRADEGTLATLLSQAVIRLVGQMMGEVAIDEALLRERCAAVAACLDSDTGKAVLEVNPADVPLLDEEALGVALSPNADLPRGSVRLATTEGWVEDGPDVRLSRLKALMDDMEGRA